MIVRPTLLTEAKSKLALSAGLVIIQDNKMLLLHPTGAPWKKSYSIPKGHVEEGEGILEAALRESKEEAGIDPDNLIIEDPEPNKFIDYTNKKGKLYKRVYYFVAHPEQPISKFKLQKKEVDWGGFLSKEEAKDRIFWRFKPLLKLLK